MLKRGIAWLLTVMLLLGMLPVTAMAVDDGRCRVCQTPKTVQRIGVGGKTQIGQQLLSNGMNVAAEYPNNPPSYVDTAEEKAAWVADQCRQKGITDPWEIALWLHDWLTYNANYDYTYSRYTAEGVLLYGTGVCESYTRAYNLLLQEFGIESIRLGANEMNHAWNLVKIDGQWCHIDVTWDDPNEGGYENHNYFGLTDERMDLDHDWNRSNPSYPACTSDINYYPVRMGLGFTTEQEMKAMLNQKADERVEEIELFYLGNDPDFPFYGVLNEWYQIAYWKYSFTSCTFLLGEGCVLVYVTYPDSSDSSHVHSYTAIKQDPYCTSEGYTIHICNKCGDQYTDDYVSPLGHDWTNSDCTVTKTCKRCGATEAGTAHAYDSQYDYKCNACGKERTVDMTRPMKNMYRMYDPNSGEHFYTGSDEEKNNLIAVGWNYEGVGFTFPLTTGKPVYRLYEPITGEHLYTMDEKEKADLMAAGWNYEGIAFNSGFENEVPQYRLHNPNETRGAYHFTASIEERDFLISIGWEYQGIGWYSLGA